MPPISFTLQDELNMKESQVNDLRANIQTQQSKTSKAKSELKIALKTSKSLNRTFALIKPARRPRGQLH